MKVYDCRGLQSLMGIGKDTAYRIMKQYGFRTGYTDKSPLRITEDGLKEYIRKETNDPYKGFKKRRPWEEV